MKKILLLSDTHSYIDDQLLKFVKQADEVWHAGDIGNIAVADTIKEHKPLRAVYGNIDDALARTEFPLDNRFTVENVDFWNNNILHSLMCARPKIEEAQKLREDVIVSYSDILYEDSVVRDLLESEKDISAIVDIDWRDYYDGRTDHPIEEAENVILDKNKKMLKIGKHIFTHDIHKDSQGEFIGLWKFTPTGIAIFLRHFDRLNAKLEMTEPFQGVYFLMFRIYL